MEMGHRQQARGLRGEGDGGELREQYGNTAGHMSNTEPAGTSERHRELDPALYGRLEGCGGEGDASEG